MSKTIEELHAELSKISESYADRIELLKSEIVSHSQSIRILNQQSQSIWTTIRARKAERADAAARLNRLYEDRKQATLPIRTEIWKAMEEIRHVTGIKENV